MTDDTMTLLLDQIQASTDGDFLRAIAAHTLQRLMEFEVDSLIGAGRHERSDERTTYRNGHRDRQLETRLGTLDLKIPKLRQGTYFPAFLEPRKTTEKALTAVIQEAWIQGVSTRKVDDLVQVLGMTGISKSQVSALCQDGSVRSRGSLPGKALADRFSGPFLSDQESCHGLPALPLVVDHRAGRPNGSWLPALLLPGVRAAVQ